MVMVEKQHYMADVAVDLAPKNPRELVLRNPIVPASGCFGYGVEYSPIIDIQRLGAFVSKGITPEPRSGNTMPRITETPAGMLNAIGLQNPGIEGFLKKYPPIWEKWDVPAIVNISAEAVEDYAMMARKLDDIPGVDAIEVNISCPNIQAAGVREVHDHGFNRAVVCGSSDTMASGIIQRSRRSKSRNRRDNELDV